MRINIYAEELPTLHSPTHPYHDEDGMPAMEIVSKYVEDTNRTYYGLRLYLKSPASLHHSVADDDRSAVTLWGPLNHLEELLKRAAVLVTLAR